MSDTKTHTRWLVQIKPGETRETRNGTRVTNTSDQTIKILIETPINPAQNEQRGEHEPKQRHQNP